MMQSAMGSAQFDHTRDTKSILLPIALGSQISGNSRVSSSLDAVADAFKSHAVRQRSRITNFDTIIEQGHMDARSSPDIIAMGNGISQSFSHNFFKIFGLLNPFKSPNFFYDSSCLV